MIVGSEVVGGSLVFRVGGSELVEGRDFTVDRAAGTVTLKTNGVDGLEPGAYRLSGFSLVTHAKTPRLPRQAAQWKRERIGRGGRQ